MLKSISIGLLAAAGVNGLRSEEFQHGVQRPLFKDACPSNAIINGECQSPDSTFTDPSNPSFGQNSSQHDSQQLPKDFPWTFMPECYSNENTSEPYCVFSKQDFASGRGIFIIDKASNAYQFLNKPAFADPNALSRVNDHANPKFETHEFPGKGRGLVANKTLHRGDQIFASTPLLIADTDVYDLVESERLALSHRGVEQLPSSSQTLFWALLDHFKGDPVDDRINTNAFEVYLLGGQTKHVVLPEIAMLNHDCRPNAAYFFDEATLSHYVHATQTIYPGEEITITYINNERARDKRMANLKENWGFDCSCSSCSAHPDLVAQSDDRIKQMKSIASALDDWTSDSTATPEAAELLISLYEQERLFASLGVAYKYAAETYSSFGDKWNAMRFARLSAEYEVLDKGFSDVDVGAMRTMAQDPAMTWSWKKRVGHERGIPGGCGHVH